MRYIIAIISCLTLAIYVLSGERTYGNVNLSSVVKVYDGDTFYGIIKTWPAILGDTIGIRIYGIDTPEMKSVSDSTKALALKAKELTESLVMSRKRVTLKNIRRDKYFRILAEVWVGNVNVADTLVKAGLAKPYFGKTKEDW